MSANAGVRRQQRDILFIQGAGAGTHDEWDSKLVESLRRELGARFAVQYPRMPDEGNPSFEAWVPVLYQELMLLTEGAIIIGHSFGGAVAVKALVSAPRAPRIDALILIAAPFIGPSGWDMEGVDFRDVDASMPPETDVLLYHGEDDDIVPVGHVDRYSGAIPRARVTRLAAMDHQLNNDLSVIARDILSRASSGQGPRGT